MFSKKGVNGVKENDRRHRGYNLAYLYFKNKDFLGAEKSALEFLSVDNNSATGYKLLGEIEEALGKREDAVKAYEKSLTIDYTQETLMSKLCDLMFSDTCDVDKLKHWAQKAGDAGFREVLAKYDKAINALESLPDNKLSSFIKNHTNSKNNSYSDQLNDSLNANTFLNSSGKSFGHNDSSESNRFVPSPERSIFTKMHQQESVLKTILLQQEKLFDANKQVLDTLSQNAQMLAMMQSAIADLRISVGNIALEQVKLTTNHAENIASQKELRDAVYEMINSNYDHYGNEDIDYNVTNMTQQHDVPIPVQQQSSFSFGFNADQSHQPIPIASNQLPVFNFNTSFNSSDASNPQPQVSTPQKVPASNVLVKPKEFSPVVPNMPTPAATSAAKEGPEIEILEVVKPSKALISKAVSFKLPENYYNYLKKPDCPGCPGCEKDESCLSESQPKACSPATAMAAKDKEKEPEKPFTFGFNTAAKDVPTEKPLFSFATAAAPTTFKFGFGGTSGVSASSGANLFGSAIQQQGAKSTGWSTSPDKQSSWMTNVSNPKPIFGQAPNNDKDAEDDLYDPEAESAVDDSQWKPVVALPEVVEIKTGEENEDIVYSQRAKVYRFDKPTKQWKERGVGDFKILKSKNECRYRLLLRRDQVHKIACNHYVNPTMKFSPMPNSTTSVCWGALDFSDGETAEELMAIKFKNSDLLKVFVDRVEEIKNELEKASQNASTLSESNDQASKISSLKSSGETELTVVDKPTLKSSGFSFNSSLKDIIAEEEKSSPRKSETVENGDGLSVDGSHIKVDKPASAAQTDDKPAFSFGFSSVNKDTTEGKSFFDLSIPTGEKDAASGEKPLFSFAPATEAQSFKFGFGSAGESTTTSDLFGSAIQQQGAKSSGWGASTDKQPSWMTNLANPTPIFGQKPQEENAEDDLYDPEADSAVDDSQWKPIVALPEIVELKTGEEDEDIVYSQRAKVYRFDKPTKQWKERGVGDFKILKSKNECRYRLLLRRDQVHKIACNHYVNSTMKFSPMPNSTTSVCWGALDFSDGETAEELMAIKFKNAELLKVFVDRVEVIKKELIEESKGQDVSATNESVYEDVTDEENEEDEQAAD